MSRSATPATQNGMTTCLETWKRRGYAASPINPARPQKNQRLETRHVGASKRAFRARLPPIFRLCSFKIDVFLRVFLRTWKFATSKSAAPATQNDDGRVQSAALAMKSATHLAKTSQKYCANHTKGHSTRYKTRLNVTKCHTCHVKRSNPMFETSKNDPFCRTYYRHGHTGIARTVADGCGRLRMVADGWATTSEHTLNPQTPRVKREPLLRIREKLTNLWILAIETASSETFRS